MVPARGVIASFIMIRYYMESLDSDTIFADITKSAKIRFDLIQGPVIDMR